MFGSSQQKFLGYFCLLCVVLLKGFLTIFAAVPGFHLCGGGVFVWFFCLLGFGGVQGVVFFCVGLWGVFCLFVLFCPLLELLSYFSILQLHNWVGCWVVSVPFLLSAAS